MTHPRFFGYGSLVNLATHDYPDPTPATLSGWRRGWRSTTASPVMLLSVEPCDHTTLHGITAQVPDHDWAALDAREHAYLRRDVSPQFVQPTAVYEANSARTAPSNTDHLILLSYLDVVIAGYQTLMGDDGPAHFWATTHGWSTISNDRADPLYPRAQPLTPLIRDTVDGGLAALSVTVKPAERALVDAIRHGRPAAATHNP